MYTVKALIKYLPKQFASLIGWGALAAMLKVGLFISLHYFIIFLRLHEKQIDWLIVAIVVLSLSFVVEHFYFKKGASLFQKLLLQLKTDIMEKVLQQPLLSFEQIGKTEFFSIISRTTGSIMQSALYLPVSLLNGGLSLLFILLYITWVSPTTAIAFVIWLFLTAIFVYIGMKPMLDRARGTANNTKTAYLHSLHNILYGFKELKLNQEKQKAVLDAQQIHSKQSSSSIALTAQIDRLRALYGEVTYFSLLFILVFVVSQFSGPQYWEVVMTILLLFLMSIRSIGSFLSTIEDWDIVNDELKALNNLSEKLEHNLEGRNANKGISDTAGQEAPQQMLRDQLTLQNIHFEYPKIEGKPTYGIGPINLTLMKGECLFIVGGNGTGKSTLLKVITQLYHQSQGSIICDGQAITSSNCRQYQSLFSIIFTDFHLFSKTYGIDEVNEGHIQHLLQLFNIDKQVGYNGEGFAFSVLSTGQQKRLAMLYAFLERRSIYIFDEVVADQDPSYRKFFYETVLPDLKKSGRTIIAVTHDDHYFHRADRILQMKDGKLIAYNTLKEA